MAQFDVYQSVGPQVDVRLFGDAAARGAQLGQAIPNPVTSMIRGAQEGYKYGLDVQAQAQQNEQRQHQIDRQPQQDAAQDIAIKNAQTVAELNELRLREQQQTEELALQDQTALLKNRTAQNNQELALRQQLTDFTTAFGDAKTAEEKLEVLESGKFGGVLAEPVLLTNSLKTVYSGLPEGQKKQSVGEILKVKGAQDYGQELARKMYPKYVEAEEALNSAPLTNALEASKELTVPVDQYPKAVKFVGADEFLYDDTGKVQKNEDGSWMRNPLPDVEGKGKYDVLNLEGKRLIEGRNDTNGDTAKGKAAYDNYSKQLSYQNGEQTKLTIQNLLRGPEQSSDTGSPRDLPTFGSSQQPAASAPPAVRTDPVTEAFQTNLDLGEQEVAAIKQPVEKINRFVQVYAQSPAFRSSPQAIAQREELTTSVARGVSNVRFDSDPTLKEQYNDEGVAAYNASLRSRLNQQADVKFFRAALMNPFKVEAPNTDKLFEAYKAKDPRDLYFINQRDVLEGSISGTINELTQKAQKKQEIGVNRQIAKRKNTAMFMQQVGNGRGY